MRALVIALGCAVAASGCALIDDFGEFEFGGTDGGGGMDGGRDGGVTPPDAGEDDGGVSIDAPMPDAGPPDGGLCGGEVCGPCTACVSGACTALADDLACPGGTCHGGACCTGCWDGTECRPGTDEAHCGLGGIACLSCGCVTDTCNDTTGECMPAEPVRTVATGGQHTCAILESDELWCWGLTGSGQIGIGVDTAFAYRALPQHVDMPAVLWQSISLGEDHSCALDDDGALYCWGLNNQGQLGLGTTTAASRPTAVSMPSTAWSALDLGGQTSCGVERSGIVRCWGSDAANVLGNGGGTRPDVPTPSPVTGAIAGARVTLGNNHGCLIDTSDHLWCWGNEDVGQTGLGTSGGFATRDVPTQVGADTWSAVSAGGRHTCAVRSPAGDLYCFGWNENGQLGLGVARTGRTPVTTPERVGTESGWLAVSAGMEHTCGIAAGGELRCWGFGGSGRLGLGGTGTVHDPMRVTGGGTWSTVSAGTFDTCAVDDHGRLFCWGAGNWGELGLGDVGDRMVPTRVCVPPDPPM